MADEAFPCELVTWEKFSEMARDLALTIKESGYTPDLVIAIGRGGYVPARVVCDYLLHDMLTSFKVEHWGMAAQEKPRVIVRFPLAVDIRDLPVLIVDDVTDTGRTLDAAVSYIRSLGPREIRTAVIQHKVKSSFCPDYYGREEREWRWIIYPWALHEDLVGFAAKVLAEGPLGEEAVRKELGDRYCLRVPIRDVRDAIGDLLAMGCISRSGNVYSLVRDPSTGSSVR
jgi:hypoxanthine phosphoribosyltransferase